MTVKGGLIAMKRRNQGWFSNPDEAFDAILRAFVTDPSRQPAEPTPEDTAAFLLGFADEEQTLRVRAKLLKSPAFAAELRTLRDEMAAVLPTTAPWSAIGTARRLADRFAGMLHLPAGPGLRFLWPTITVATVALAFVLVGVRSDRDPVPTDRDSWTIAVAEVRERTFAVQRGQVPADLGRAYSSPDSAALLSGFQALWVRSVDGRSFQAKPWTTVDGVVAEAILRLIDPDDGGVRELQVPLPAPLSPALELQAWLLAPPRRQTAERLYSLRLTAPVTSVRVAAVADHAVVFTCRTPAGYTVIKATPVKPL